MADKLRIPRWHEVLLEIYKNGKRPKYCQRIGRKINGSLTYLRNVVDIMAKEGLVKIIPLRKIKRIEITGKGIRIASAILAIKSELH